jgi:Bacterial Ig-like domain (group 2)
MQNSHTLGRSRSSTSERFHPGTIALVIAAVMGVWGCGGSPASSPPASPPPRLISVTVTPNSVTVVRGATQSFAAMVTGTTNTAVAWSVQEPSGGTIDSAGLYTAPQHGDGTFHVVATSQANSAAKGIAAVVVPMAQVTISPAAVTMLPGGSRTFAAAVSGVANTGVTWTIQETGGGLITAAGLYTAPSAEGFYHVLATSVEDTTVTASSTITVTTSSGRFTPTGSLKEARGFHTATLLANGKVLVAGGANNNSPCPDGGIASAELYNSAAGSFVPTFGQSVFVKYDHTATLLSTGEVLLAGGFGDGFDCLGAGAGNVAELYDPVAGLFNQTGNMVALRGGQTATLLANGKVLVAGGADQDPTGTGSASAEVYDPGTGTFTQTGSMAVGRFRHTATLLQNGKVLIIGGVLLSSSNPTSTAEVYDPATGSFTLTGAMTTAREEHTATLLNDGKVLIVGGASSVTGSGDLRLTATAEVYDPSTGSFSVSGSMTRARSLHTATLLPSGKVLIAGGGDDNSTAELYDPAIGSFSITGSMEVGRSGHSATLLPNGSVLVVGGGSLVGIATAELYQ